MRIRRCSSTGGGGVKLLFLLEGIILNIICSQDAVDSRVDVRHAFANRGVRVALRGKMFMGSYVHSVCVCLAGSASAHLRHHCSE